MQFIVLLGRVSRRQDLGPGIADVPGLHARLSQKRGILSRLPLYETTSMSRGGAACTKVRSYGPFPVRTPILNRHFRLVTSWYW